MSATITLKKFGSTTLGETGSYSDITECRREDIFFEQTVGNEFFIESGELKIKTDNEAAFIIGTFPQPDFSWIGLYVNSQLIEVFSNAYKESYDEKSGQFIFRFQPLQKIFIDNLKETLIQYSTDTDSWNYNLGDADLVISSITAQTGGTPISALNRYGFSLFDMLTSLLGQSNDFGYDIGAITIPGPVMNNNDLPILFRGISFDSGDTLQNAINKTFYEDGTNIYHISWWDIFRLAAFGFNSFLKVRPVMVDVGGTDYLNAYISMIPRINESPSGAITVLEFAERKTFYEKHRIDGVKLTGLNFEYTQGVINSDNVFTFDVPIADYDEDMSTASVTLYWAEGDYNGGTLKYDLQNPYFASGLVEAYYSDMISIGDGIDAKARLVYNDGAEKILKVLDQVQFGTTPTITFHINRLKFGGLSDLADIEGIVIDET